MVGGVQSDAPSPLVVPSSGHDEGWYVRYPIAVLMLWGAWYLFNARPIDWWLVVLSVVTAAIAAREISVLVLAGTIGYAVFTDSPAVAVSLTAVAITVIARKRMSAHQGLL